MVATYNGKVIVNPPSGLVGYTTFQRPQNVVDILIANDTRWATFIEQGERGPNIDTLVYDDGQPITDWVLYTDVPGDADFWIVSEPAFYTK